MTGLCRRVAALVLFGIVIAAPSVQARERVALVIGNGDYENAPLLPNPPNDARAMVEALEALDFEVVTGFDVDRKEMAATFHRFSAALRGASVGLFFYAGHGLQVEGRNYLVPVDADLGSEADLHFEAVPLDLVLGELERVRRTSVVFLDACRDNPLARNLARRMGPARSSSVGRGLAAVDAGIGTLIAYATQPGNVALDGSGKHSPFTAALLEHIGAPGIEARQMLTRVRQEVISTTDGEQVPWDHSSLTGDFFFNRKASEPAPPPAEVAKPEPDSAQGELDVALELEFWQAIKDSRSPDVYRAYLKRFPDGTFAPIAQARIDVVKSEATETTATASVQATPADDAASTASGTEAYATGAPTASGGGTASQDVDAPASPAAKAQETGPEASPPPSDTQTALLTPGPADEADAEPEQAAREAEAPEAVEPAPEEDEEKPDDADLSRAEKMRIQRSLRALGLYRGAIDALFGPGTRGAITAWQRSIGATQSGVLTEAETRRLHAAAADREREREAEREERAEAAAETTAEQGGGRGTSPSVATAPATSSYEGRWSGSDTTSGWSVNLHISGNRVTGDIIYSGLHGTANGLIRGTIDSNGYVAAVMNSNQMLERRLRGRLPRLTLDDGGYRGGGSFTMQRQ